MKYEYWFANIRGINSRKKQEIRAKAGNAKALYYIEETVLKKLGIEEKDCHKIQQSVKEWKVEAEYEKLKEKQVSLVTIFDAAYPDKLKEIHSPPYALYVKGRLPDQKKMSAAIVGARECTMYGKRMAELFAGELARNGIQIISGMATGIDSAGQCAALSAGGTSYGILGSGADICYPRENFALYMDLQKHGGIISEQPLGMQPLSQNFPARNRIISALSDVVLVIEAKEKSGSLITADMALEQGKDVYALPGSVESRLSQGCHYLIKQGAGILLSPEDLLGELGVSYRERMEKTTENKILLETQENMVYSCLDFQPKNLSEILELTKVSVPVLMNLLISLELKGYIREIAKNYYVKVK